MFFSRRFIAFLAGFSAMFCFSGAAANNGIQTYQSDIDPAEFYIACLGESVRLEGTIFGRYQEFETPSGNWHLVDNWRYAFEFTGLITGRKWFARGVSPFTQNIGPGGTQQWAENIVAKPVAGDGPMFKIHVNNKVTVNANGELVVFFNTLDGVAPEDWYQCMGKP